MFTGVAAASAQAQMAKPEDTLALRKGVFQVIRASFGPMAGFADGKVQLDAARVQVLGARLAAVAPMVSEVFPAGSEKVEGSKAKPEIWTKAEDFKAKNAAFQTAAAKLAEAAKSGNLEAVKAAVPELGKACKGCHEDYKEK
jgi:cytochrome c556